MADNWYYVQKGNRQGPVEFEVISSMITKQELRADDFVWKKGFENWMKIKEVPELDERKLSVFPEPIASVENEFSPAPVIQKNETEFSFISITDQEERILFIRIGNDRGGASSDYGPFSMNQIKQLFKEKRINGKTFIFTTSMKDWKVLGDIADYQEVFQEEPPEIKESDRRTSQRKPFIARLFVQDNKKLFEGLCRDISVGGMQVLVNEYKGQAGDKISITVHPENSDYNFEASGTVVRVLEGNSGFSFRFDHLNADAKKSIDKYIQDN